jgi:hypothetical protein
MKIKTRRAASDWQIDALWQMDGLPGALVCKSLRPPRASCNPLVGRGPSSVQAAP